MKFNYVIAVICLFLAVQIVVGSFNIFLINFPRKLYDAFGSTWTIIKKNLNVTVRPTRFRNGFRRTTPLKPIISIIEEKVPPTTPLSLVSITETPIPEQATARRRYVHRIPFLITRQTSVFWWRMTTKPSDVATSSLIPMDFDDHTHKVRYALARRNNILYPVKRLD